MAKGKITISQTTTYENNTQKSNDRATRMNPLYVGKTATKKPPKPPQKTNKYFLFQSLKKEDSTKEIFT